MGKGKRKQHANQSSSQASGSGPISAPSPSVAVLGTTTAIASDPTLGYKLCVLLYDFLNITKDPNAERRINATTDEHYISLPYFSQDEATKIKSAIVDTDLSHLDLSVVLPGYADDVYEEERGENENREVKNLGSVIETLENKTFDGALRALMMSFIDKRRASGDARP